MEWMFRRGFVIRCDTVYLVFKAVRPNYGVIYAISPASNITSVPSMSSPVTVSVVFVTVEATTFGFSIYPLDSQHI